MSLLEIPLRFYLLLGGKYEASESDLCGGKPNIPGSPPLEDQVILERRLLRVCVSAAGSLLQGVQALWYKALSWEEPGMAWVRTTFLRLHPSLASSFQWVHVLVSDLTIRSYFDHSSNSR